MIGSWVVGAFIRFETNGVATMQRLAAASSAANTTFMRQQKQISASEAALANYQRRIESIKASLRSFTARAAGIFAIGGAAGMAVAIDGAAKLQVNMVGVGNATAATAEQLKRLQGFAFTLGDITGQTPDQAAVMIAQTARLVSGVQAFQARGGGLNVAAFERMMTNDIAKFAVVQAYGRGMDMNQAAVMGFKLAHMFQEFSPQGMHRMLGEATVISELMPDTLEKLLTQSKYFVPVMKALHVSDEQALATYALLDRYGIGTGRSGTAVARVIEQALGPLRLTTHAQVAANSMLVGMGVLGKNGRNLFFNPKTNQFDWLGFAEQLHRYSTHISSDELIKEFKGIFGYQGVNLAAVISNKDFIHNLNAIRNLEKNKAIGLDEQYAKYHTTFSYNWRRTLSNAQGIMQELAWPWLTDMSKWLDKFATRLHSFWSWLHAHRDIEKRIGEIAAAVTAFLGGLSLYLGSQLVALPFKVNAAAGAMHRLAIAVEEAGTAAGAGAKAAAAGAAEAEAAAGRAAGAGGLGLFGALGAGALFFGGLTWAQIQAARAGMERLKHGTNATENQQRHGYHIQHRFDSHGNLILGPAHGAHGGASQHVHVQELHLHVNGDEHEAGKKAGKFFDGLHSPLRTLSTSGTIRTAPHQPSPMSISNGAFGR